MAKVEMDLAELDQMREKIKSLENENSDLQNEITRITVEKDKEIEAWKSDSRVIVKQPYHNYVMVDTYVLTNLVVEKLEGIIGTHNYYSYRDILNHSYLQKLINDACQAYQANQYFNHYQPNSIELIEKVTNFDDVKKQVEEYYVSEIESYKANMKSIEEIKNIYESQIKRLNTEILNNGATAREEYLKNIADLKTEQIKEIEKLKEEHAKELKSMKPKSEQLEEVLAEMGYKFKKGLFGTKLVPQK